ncbi:MAG: hypothetical protein AB8H86_14835 [Polyangiales bacterium]
MSQTKSLLLLLACATLIAGPAAAQDTAADAPQDVFIVEPEAQPAEPDGYPAQQPQGYPAQQPQGYPAQPAQTQPAAQPAPVYAQPYQQPQPAYAPQQPLQGRRLRAPYVEGAPMPPGGVLVERRRTGLVVSGAVMFGVPWITTLLIGVAFEEGAVGIPVIGPLLYLGNGSRAGDTMIVVDSLLQAGGLTMFILGMVMKRRYVEYYGDNDTDGRQWSLLPQLGTTNGLQLDMRF